jgi:hypothetical protein
VDRPPPHPTPHNLPSPHCLLLVPLHPLVAPPMSTHTLLLAAEPFATPGCTSHVSIHRIFTLNTHLSAPCASASSCCRSAAICDLKAACWQALARASASASAALSRWMRVARTRRVYSCDRMRASVGWCVC